MSEATEALERRKLEAEADAADYDAQIKALELNEKIEAHNRAAASDTHHRVYRFIGDVEDDETGAVSDAVNTIERWAREDEYNGTTGNWYTFEICSAGGVVLDGWRLFDALRRVSRRGHPILTVVSGFAGSMAGVLSQAGDHRVIGANSYLHLHEASAMAFGTASALKDSAEFTNRLTEHMIRVYVERSGGRISPETIRDKINRTDWYVSAQEALDYGLVDEIR